jgi:radical SAM superfamily enzyme YgiQ (UPF0313 family)
MARILLISINQCETPYPVFPLGLAYIDAALQSAGHVTKWLDFQAERPPLAPVLAQFRPDYVGISVRNIDDVLIKHRETFFGELNSLCSEIRCEHSCPIILGGSGFSIFPKELLDYSGADFGIHGEGEHALLSLLDALEKRDDVSGLPGLVFRHADRIALNPRAAPFPDRNFGAPARPDVLIDFYLEKSAMLNVQTQRGCAFHCCYCTYPLIEGQQYHRRPPDAVAAEFESLQARGAKYVFIVDAVFNSCPEHVAGIAEALLRRNVTLPWGCFLRPKGITPDLMRLIARAGLAHIEFGSDSFCDSVLDAYGKRFTFDDICESSEMARRENVDYCHFLIAGGPGETRETLWEGFENSRRLTNAVILALVGMRLYPGTALLAHVMQESSAYAQADFLQPHYYLSAALNEEQVFEQLREFARRSPNWIIGDPPPAYLKAIERLRARGVVGPLWGYFALMQRLTGTGLTHNAR